MTKEDGNSQLDSHDQAGGSEWPEQVVGGKYVRLLEKYMRQLRTEDEHGNRKLFLDDVFIVYLLAFFNPSVRTLRTVEDFSQAPRLQEFLSIRRICKSTLSDFNQLADSERLQPILAALRGQLARKFPMNSVKDHDLNMLLKQTIAVDGTFIPAVAEVAWAIRNANNHGAQRHRARIDCHLNVSTWLPEVINVPDVGESEADSAKTKLLANHIYLYDRGYMSYSLLAAHYDTSPDEPLISSYFVSRYKAAGGNSPELRDAVERELSEADKAAGVVSDRVGYFVPSNAQRYPLPRVKLREVIIVYVEDGIEKRLRLITNLMDISAKTVGQLYRNRWQVELFFRWFKSIANFGHLISHTRDGVLTHLYVTLIATLLMYLHTGYRPSKYTFALLNHVAAGLATLEEIMPIIRERERQCEVARQSAARRRAKTR